jgi:hypothetical protein
VRAEARLPSYAGRGSQIKPGWAATNDWRDVVQRKISVPTAIFTGEYSDSLPVQKWLHSVIPGSRLHI